MSWATGPFDCTESIRKSTRRRGTRTHNGTRTPKVAMCDWYTILYFTQQTLHVDSLIVHFLYGFFGGFHIVFFHEGIHGRQLYLSPEIRVNTAVGHRSVWKILRWVTKLNMKNEKNRSQQQG